MLIRDIINRLPLQNFTNVKHTIDLISSWLYELNQSTTKNEQKYKNLSNTEYKDIYNIIEIKAYKTYFSFTTYETNKKLVLIYFIKYIYDVSLPCAKILYSIYKNNSYNNEYMTDIINNDRVLQQK